MLFMYDKNSKKLSQYKETDFKKHKIFERQDMEKWIEDHTEILGEELIIITTEYDKFDRTTERLDIMALDKNGSLAIIELKRDDSGKTVELQAIKYAAYCSTLTFENVVGLYQQYRSKKGEEISLDVARSRILDFIQDDNFEEINDKPRIILASREFSPEVTSCILWLRKFNLDIRCIKLTPYEINSETLAFESNVLIPLPEAEEFIIKSEEKENAEHSLSLSQQEYLRFYNELAEKIMARLPLSLARATPFSYYQIPSGTASTHFEWAFHGRPRNSFAVELHFESADREINKKRLAGIEKMIPIVEQQTKEEIIIQKEWGKNWSRIFIEKDEGKMVDSLKTWAIENMLIFYNQLKPELDKLK